MIFFGIGNDGEERLGHKTFQVAINRLAAEWLALEELPDAEFDEAIDNLNSRYVRMSERARKKASADIAVRYFDAGSDDQIAFHS